MGSQTRVTRHAAGVRTKNAAPTDDVMAGHPALPVDPETGERDAHYDLISVLYHSLQGEETYSRYIADAERAGERELVQFFVAVREEEKLRAKRAKALLGARLGGFSTGLDEDEEE